MEITSVKRTAQDAVKYLVVYVCWILTAAATMLTMLWMRSTLNVVWPLLGGSRWVLRAVDRFALLLMGLGWLIYVIWIEQYYRGSIRLSKARRQKARAAQSEPVRGSRGMVALSAVGLDVLAQRFALAFGIPAALFGLMYLVQQVAFWTLGR